MQGRVIRRRGLRASVLKSSGSRLVSRRGVAQIITRTDLPVVPVYDIGDVLSYAAIQQGTYASTASGTTTPTGTLSTQGQARADGYVFVAADVGASLYIESVTDGAGTPARAFTIGVNVTPEALTAPIASYTPATAVLERAVGAVVETLTVAGNPKPSVTISGPETSRLTLTETATNEWEITTSGEDFEADDDIDYTITVSNSEGFLTETRAIDVTDVVELVAVSAGDIDTVTAGDTSPTNLVAPVYNDQDGNPVAPTGPFYRVNLGARSTSFPTVAATDALAVEWDFANGGESVTASISTTVQAPAGGGLTTINYKTVGFTDISNVISQGTHFDGTPWIEIGAGAQMASVTPISEQLTHHFWTARLDPTPTSEVHWANGMRFRPGRALTGTTLQQKQAANDFGPRDAGGDLIQGYGWKSPHKSNYAKYDHSLNVDPGATGQPITLQPGVYTKAISYTDIDNLTWSGRPGLQYLVPLTVYAQGNAPAANSIRPAYAGDGTPTGITLNDLDMTPYKNLSDTGYIEGVIPFAEAAELFKMPQVLEHTYRVNADNLMALNDSFQTAGSGYYTNSYQGYTHRWRSDMRLMCHYDTWTLAEKRIAVGHLVQKALDASVRILEGGIFYANGGHSLGELDEIAEAYVVTGEQVFLDALNAVNVSQQNDGYTGGESVFGDANQFGYLTQADIDASANLYNSNGTAIVGPAQQEVDGSDPVEFRSAAYTNGQLGHPFWSGNTVPPAAVGALKSRSDQPYNIVGNIASTNLLGGGYINSNSGGFVPSALSLLHIPAAAALVRARAPARMDFADLFGNAGVARTGLTDGVFLTDTTPVFKDGGINSFTRFAESAWANTRAALGGVWSSGVTQALALTEAPFDGYVWDVGQGAPTTASMVASGVGTSGDVVEVYLEATNGGSDTAMQAVTVDSAGNWSATFTLGASDWDQWYLPRFREQGETTYLTGTNHIGIGHNILVFGQSELAYFMKPGSFYMNTPRTYLPDEGFTMLVDDADDASAITSIRATQANFQTSGGNAAVNPGVLSAYCAIREATAFQPRKWNFIDGVDPGTGPNQLFDASNASRSTQAFLDMVDLVQSGGSDVGLVILNWVNNPAASLPTMLADWSPWIFGQHNSGAAWTVGTPNAESIQYVGEDIDFCMWDVEVATSERGRGLFSRDRTKLHLMGALPFADTGTTEDFQYDNGLRVTRNSREGMEAFAADSRTQTLLQDFGPSTHISDFGGGIHPLTNDLWGIPQFGQLNLAAPCLTLAGSTVMEPEATGATISNDGTTITLAVSNKGDGMSTGRKDASGAAPSPLPPHWQPVIGVELTINGVRRPVWNSTAVAADSVSYDPAWEGVVDFDPNGDLEVVLVTALTSADTLEAHFLEGQASALLLEPRDVTAQVYLDMPYATRNAWVDASADHPFTGIPLKPQPPAGTLAVDMTGISAAPPAGAHLVKGADSFFKDTANVGAGVTRITNRGTFNFPTTPANGARIFAQESQGNNLSIDTGGGTFLSVRVEELNNASPVLEPVRVQEASADYAVAIGADLDIVFDTDWAAGTVDITVNGVAMDQLTFTSPQGAAEDGRELSVGATSSGGSQLPTGTQMSGLSFDINGVLHKTISDTADTANADAWKQGADDFTQG